MISWVKTRKNESPSCDELKPEFVCSDSKCCSKCVFRAFQMRGSLDVPCLWSDVPGQCFLDSSCLYMSLRETKGSLLSVRYTELSVRVTLVPWIEKSHNSDILKESARFSSPDLTPLPIPPLPRFEVSR